MFVFTLYREQSFFFFFFQSLFCCWPRTVIAARGRHHAQTHYSRRADLNLLFFFLASVKLETSLYPEITRTTRTVFDFVVHPKFGQICRVPPLTRAPILLPQKAETLRYIG